MPYKIEQEGNRFKVVATTTGRVMGTHGSKAQAQAQLGALYANDPHVKKCVTCGCDDLGNDHHYISDTEKCDYCVSKGQGPCWEGYEYIGTKTKNGKKVPNCVPKNVKKETAGGGMFGGGIGFELAYNVPDCQGGYAIVKSGTGQVVGCYTTKAHAEDAMKSIAVSQPDVTKSVDEGIGSLNTWGGAFSPFAHKPVKGEPMTPTYNSPPQKDGQPSAGYANSSSPEGKSNS